MGRGHLVLEKLEAMTSVCSVGLDMIAIPGDTPAETIAAIIADEMAIGVINNKTTAVPPGSRAGRQGGRHGRFRRAVRLDARDGGPQRRRQRRLRPLRRPHPGADPVAEELKNGNISAPDWRPRALLYREAYGTPSTSNGFRTMISV